MDEQLFASLTDQLERIEVGIDPYGDPDLLEQWVLCIGNIMRQSQTSVLISNAEPTAGKFAGLSFHDSLCAPTV